MQLKRERHRQYQTRLLETYSYYNKKNILLEKLEAMLKSEGVNFSPLSEKDIYEKVIEHDSHFGKELSKLISSFINLSKSRKITIERLQRIFGTRKGAASEFMHSRQNLFLNFTLPILKKYNWALEERNEIDFNDMINWATDLIKKNGIPQKYEYIIIDEYQDISMARFELIKAIRELSDAKLICVGDDWQSIYKFAGSDISLFCDFGKFVGEHEKLFIEHTYRNSQQLIDVSVKFIQQNLKQIKKNPRSQKNIDHPVEFVRYERTNTAMEVMNVIERIVNQYGRETKILILGRYNSDIEEILAQDTDKKIRQYNANTNVLKITKFENVDIRFMTAHKAKGLEADNVIILNVKNDVLGFPNKLIDDVILSLLLGEEEEDCRFAEERRLFYVTLTRTKNKVYLLVPESPSLFIEEIRQYTGHGTSKNLGGLGLVHCPWCKTGELVIRKKGEKEFLGCSHYPKCNQSYNDVTILNKPILCPLCKSGFLVKRHGKFGDFLGCTNYPECKQTLELK